MRIRESLFAKMILLIISYGILFNVFIILFLSHNQNLEQINHNRKILSKMEEILIQDIGNPPDSVKAKEISDEFNINIQFNYKEINWTSSNTILPIEEISRYKEFKENENDTNYFSFFLKEKIYGVNKIKDGIIVLSYYYDPQEAFDSETIVLAIVLHLCLFLVPVYFILKWLLKPIESISNIVNQIAEGDFDVKLSVKRSDELGNLAESLKIMSSRVKDSINAKEQLLKDISHELRTPLTRIKFGLELGSPKEKINDDVTELEGMIKKTLDYYRNEFFFLEANMNDTNVIPLLENVISSFDIETTRIVFYNFTKNKKKIIIKGDEEKLTIAFRNLISNALKYSPADKRILVGIDDTDRFYKIIVKDYGVGMKREDMNKIFEPFARIDSSRSKKTGGYGLGLAIVKKIIDLHNGIIEVKSKENEGTEMIVKFKKIYL